MKYFSDDSGTFFCLDGKKMYQLDGDDWIPIPPTLEMLAKFIPSLKEVSESDVPVVKVKSLALLIGKL